MSESASLLDKDIAVLNLPVRARKAARNINAETVGALVRITADDLLECKNFGVTSLKHVRERLAEVGLTLAGETLPTTQGNDNV